MLSGAAGYIFLRAKWLRNLSGIGAVVSMSAALLSLTRSTVLCLAAALVAILLTLLLCRRSLFARGLAISGVVAFAGIAFVAATGAGDIFVSRFTDLFRKAPPKVAQPAVLHPVAEPSVRATSAAQLSFSITPAGSTASALPSAAASGPSVASGSSAVPVREVHPESHPAANSPTVTYEGGINTGDRRIRFFRLGSQLGLSLLSPAEELSTKLFRDVRLRDVTALKIPRLFDDSSSWRLCEIRLGLVYFADEPVFGQGLGRTYFLVVADNSNSIHVIPTAYVHNLPAYILMAGGLLGALAYIVLLAPIAWLTWNPRIDLTVRAFVLATAIFLLAYACFFAVFRGLSFNLTLGALVGLAWARLFPRPTSSSPCAALPV